MITKIKENIKLLRSQISVFEYILWWAVRFCMVLHIIRQFSEEHTPVEYALPIINASATFIIFLVKLIFPKKSLLGRLSFRAQTFVTAMVFFGYFLAHYPRIHYPLRYDWVIHFVSGIVITFLGYTFLEATNNKKTVLSPEVSACGSMGFSFFIIIAWEIMEFGGDFLFGGTNQDYRLQIEDTDILEPILSKGVPGAEQYPLFDTMVDMTLAFFTTIFAGIILYAILKHKEKKNQPAVIAEAGEVKEPVTA